MRYSSLDAFLTTGDDVLAKGPVAMIFVEDLAEVEATILHHMTLKFGAILVFAPPELTLSSDIEAEIHRITYSMQAADALTRAVNAINDAAPGTWMYYCFNAEFLFYPFCDTRSIAEMLEFHTQERRDAMLTYVIDLYAADLTACPNAVNTEETYLDRSGYYAQARTDPDKHDHPKDRQLDFFGGLRWRFEEHVAPTSRKIDRIAIFRAAKGLRLRPDHTFSVEEYNTYACPWHNNITAAICSFRTAKALKTNAGSTREIDSFHWHNSTRFTWNPQQLLDLGLMEPGQWF